jgi:hypothetical protein
MHSGFMARMFWTKIELSTVVISGEQNWQCQRASTEITFMEKQNQIHL